MKYIDRIYGEIEIDEPVLLELISCKSMQRLKGVDQYGYYEPQFPGHVSSRFDHSMGVFILLRRYGAPLEEQIAGLIHDVSHSAFSHCIDYAKDDVSGKGQGHQDMIFDDFVSKTEIPGILTKYGIDLDYVMDDSNFPLKERNLPDLCADRIDYLLRDSAVSNEISEPEVKNVLGHLKAENGRWFFDDLESAEYFKDLFRLMNEKYFSSINAGVMLSSVGFYLRHALKKNYITWEDLYSTDRLVLEKIAKHHNEDEELLLLFEKMNMKYGFVNDPDNYQARVFCKSRLIDPLFWGGGNLRRVSDVDAEWARVMKKGLDPKEYFIRFLD